MLRWRFGGGALVLGGRVLVVLAGLAILVMGPESRLVERVKGQLGVGITEVFHSHLVVGNESVKFGNLLLEAVIIVQ